MDPKLYKAAADGNIHALQAFDEIPVQLTPKKNTVLHIAAQFGRAELVEEILRLSSTSSLLQQRNEKGDTPLHLAAREGHSSAVKKLIAAAKRLRGGRSVCEGMLRMSNEEGDTALHEAVRYHHPLVVELLIKEDPDFIYGANDEGSTPLFIAVERGFGALVQVILQNCSSLAYSGIKGRTALHAAVILNDQAMTKKILDWKPDLTQELDEDGWSPLHFAANVGSHPRIVRQLLEKSERLVVYLGVKDHEIGNRTALHIAANRGHVEVVKVLLSHFPDCCEQVDDQGSNVLHLIMSDKKTFMTSGLSDIRWLRVRGLMNEKNVEGKTPLQLFDNSTSATKQIHLVPPETMFMGMLNTFVGLLRRTRDSKVRMRASSSLEIKENSGISSRESKEREEISEMKKTIKSHMIVAALIATVTFAAGFTLPGGYVQSGSDNQLAGMAVFSLPSNTTDGSNQDMVNEARLNFRTFVIADSIAMILSICAIGIYLYASFPIKDKKTIHAYLWYGYALIMSAMYAMVIALGKGLQAVLHPASGLESTAANFYPVFYILFSVPIFLTLTPSPRWNLYSRKVKSYVSM